MKKATKRLLAAFLALAMVFTLLAVPATSMKDVSAATSKTVYINPYSDRVVSYKPGRVTQASGVISIMGCTKASQIKKLKCSNKNMKVSAKDGYIRVDYGKKAGKATITCTVKGVKLKTTFTVKKIYQSCKFNQDWKQELYIKLCKEYLHLYFKESIKEDTERKG